MANKTQDKKYRDAGTGRYVTKKYADRHPGTTVGETPSPRGNGGKRKK
ncbi:hypothetical protein [Algiphilus sp.]|nr:hypothetical protein [Algiphilus sp.]MCK5769478.1 hypothetical protein [Algiphilus sp.]